MGECKPFSITFRYSNTGLNVKCTKCGSEEVDQVKTWKTVMVPKASKQASVLTTGLYHCQKCNTKFKVKLESKKVSFADTIKTIKSLEAQLMQVSGEKALLEERIKVLEDEKKRLFEDIETLKSVARIINVLEGELMEFKARKAELEEKINALTKEKEELLKRIEDLKTQLEIKELESKAKALEAEVEALRAEEKSLMEKLAGPETTGCGQ